jgi:hypothetical protein
VANATSITNRALSMLGAARIGVLASDDSPQAAIALELYQPTVDALLSEWDWRFAVEVRQLSQVAEPLPAGADWDYQYAIPTNCLRLIRLDVENIPYEVVSSPTGNEGGQRRLYSNESELWAHMVIRKEAALWPAHFAEALVYRFAAVLAMPITRRVDFAQAFDAKADAAVAKAKAIDWNEQPWPEIQGGRMLADAQFGE